MSNFGRCNYIDENGFRCGSVATIKVPLANRGGRNACFCERCASRMESYSTKNIGQRGSVYVNDGTYGIELESHGTVNDGSRGGDIVARMELSEKGYIPSFDSTVDIEFKSPIYQGFKAPIKVCNTIERLINDGHLSIDNYCGTHFHVGNKSMINAETMTYIRRFYNSLFVPLSRELESDSETCEKVFGRHLGYWSDGINMNTDAWEHTNFINVQHNNTLEFRIMFFRNAKQYQNGMRCCKAITECVIKNFVEHFNDNNANRAYRLHKAQVTSNKIVKIYRKYAALV